MAEIVNCPFCGGIATVGGLVPWVECQSCGASGPQKTTEAEAIAAWNTRHGDADRSAELTTAWMAGAERERERAAEAWQPIESAPEGQLVVVCWRDEEDAEHPDRYEFDYLEDGVWQKHDDDYQHFCAVAPAGSRGPSERAPYTGWRPLPAARAGERGAT